MINLALLCYQDHQDILKQLVDLIGTTSIMEVGWFFFCVIRTPELGSTFITHLLET